jgi:uncharacterized protein
LLVEVTIQSLGLDRTSNTPVVILQESGGKRVLPIWIGPGEASAIAMRLAEMDFSRPLTHDLLVSVLKELGGELREVIISRVTDSTYYAELVIARNGSTIRVDARPSDSIAVALRSHARIFAHEALLEHVSIEIEEGETLGEITFEETPEHGPASAPSEREEDRPMNPEELKEYLRRMNPEDFGRFTP